MGFLKQAISAAATLTVVAAAAALLALGGLIAAGFQPEVVRSGSMRPMLERGSLIFVKPTPATQLKRGQVITFQNPIREKGQLVTHRIVDIKQADQGLSFVTKGDANNTKDPWLAHVENDAGLLKFDVPYVGHLSFIVHSQGGYIALFVIPLFLISGLVLMKIWRSSEPDDEAAGGPGEPPPATVPERPQEVLVAHFIEPPAFTAEVIVHPPALPIAGPSSEPDREPVTYG